MASVPRGVPPVDGLSAAVIIPAAGIGRRFRESLPHRRSRRERRKPFLTLRGRPLLAWSLLACEATPIVSEVVLAVHRDDRARALALVKRYRCRKVRAVVPGGATRAESVYRGLQAVSAHIPIVAVHDAARPLVTPALVTRVVRAAARTGAALAAAPMVPTTKLVDRRGRVMATLDRRRLWAAQTPQAFRRDVLEAAYRRTRGRAWRQVTDESALVEQCGVRSCVVEDTPRNVKITTRDDLRVAEALLR